MDTLAPWLLALHLVLLHGPDNQTVLINPEQVIALRDPRGKPGDHFHAAVKCLVFTSDSKYTPTLETCAEVRDKLEQMIDEDRP